MDMNLKFRYLDGVVTHDPRNYLFYEGLVMDQNFKNLFSAVNTLHKANILHRDIKTENIMTNVDLSLVG